MWKVAVFAHPSLPLCSPAGGPRMRARPRAVGNVRVKPSRTLRLPTRPTTWNTMLPRRRLSTVCLPCPWRCLRPVWQRSMHGYLVDPLALNTFSVLPNRVGRARRRPLFLPTGNRHERVLQLYVRARGGQPIQLVRLAQGGHSFQSESKKPAFQCSIPLIHDTASNEPRFSVSEQLFPGASANEGPR
jgi:hypothetical protein